MRHLMLACWIGWIAWIGCGSCSGSAAPAPSRPIAHPQSEPRVGTDEQPSIASRAFQLLSAAAATRATEGRLWGAGNYSPFDVTAPRSPQSIVALAQATAAIEKEIADPPTTDGLHALGLIALSSGRAASGVAHLESAAARAPNLAAIRNDLAVALLARADEGAHFFELARALDAVAAAADLAPDRPEVVFNLALLLTKVGLADAAKERWQRFAAIETDPRWQAEGAAHLASLAGPSYLETWSTSKRDVAAGLAGGDTTALDAALASHLQPLRQWGEEEVLPAWADAALGGDTAAAQRALALAQRLGAAVRRQSGDSMLEEATATIARTAVDESAGRELARGHHAFAAGLAAYRIHDVSAALASFSTAEAALARGGSPFRHWATFFHAASLYQLTRYPEAGAAFAALSKLIDGSSYLSLRGRTSWSAGVIHYATGAPTAAQRDYEQAIRLFETAGEQENTATLEVLLAEIYFDYYGLDEPAWTLLHSALALQSRCLDPRRRQLILADAAIASSGSGLPRAAALFISPAIAAAVDPVEEATTLLRRADYLVQGGSVDLARVDLTRVRALLDRIGEPEIRDVVAADLHLAEGTVIHRGEPELAVASLSDAVRLYERTRGQLGLLAALTARGELLGQAARVGEARADLLRAVGLLQGIGAQALDGPSRQSFLDKRYRLVDALVDVELDAGDDRAALAWADRFRASDQLGAPPEPVPPAANRADTVPKLQAAMPAGTLALYFVLLPDRLVAWSITPSAFRRVDSPISRAEVVGGIREVSARGFARDGLARLFDVLLRPFAAELLAAKSVTIFPDRELNLVPFAALEDRSTGRFVVESHAVEVSPSLLSSAAEAAAGWRPQRVLAIGNPAMDAALAPHFEPLSESEPEARELAAQYPNADVLIGAAATPSRFLAEAPTADVLHVSAHSVPGGGEYPSSRLLLAADPSRPASGLLTAEDLVGLRLPKRPLVFLSACHGATGAISESAGALSLTSSFLRAGARAVVASLWAVDDGAAHTLAIEFHRRLQLTADPLTALRGAQLALLSSDSAALHDPRTWGAFVLAKPPAAIGR